MPGQSRATQELVAHSGGDPNAASRLLPLVYDQLRALAGRHMRGERPDHTLQPTALVNEAWMRLFQGQGIDDPQGRRHFFALAARVMRQVLVDHARRRGRDKRGGGEQPKPLEGALALAEVEGVDVLDLDTALEELAGLDARQARVVELRFFGGLEAQEVAEVLEVSLSTVERDWRAARAWLYQRLAG